MLRYSVGEDFRICMLENYENPIRVPICVDSLPIY